MIDPITATLTAGTVVGNILQSRQAQKAAAENLAFQKWLANEQIRMGQASRVDQYGNVVQYNKALNKWETVLDPYQDQLAKAGEHEQYLQLTQDAGRNRQVRERAFQRGQDAGEDYTRARAGYNYDTGPSEGAIRSELTDLILKGRNGESGGGQNLNNFLRQRGNLPVVSSGRGKSSGVSDIANAILQARSGALSERGQRDQQRASKYLPAMQSSAAMMDAGGGGSVSFPNFDYLNKNQSDQAGDALKAFGQAGKGVEGAYGNITNAAKLGIQNPAQIASALRGYTGSSASGKVKPIASSTTYNPDERSIDEIMYDF